MSRTTLHLLRSPGERPEDDLIAPADIVLNLEETTPDALLDAILRSDAVAVW